MHTLFTRDSLALLALFVLLAAGWFVLYVNPQDSVNQQIAFCQLEIGDRSYAGYEYCFNKLKPTSR